MSAPAAAKKEKGCKHIAHNPLIFCCFILVPAAGFELAT